MIVILKTDAFFFLPGDEMIGYDDLQSMELKVSEKI